MSIDYQSEQIYQLAFCLELADSGVIPSQIALVVKSRWSDKIYRYFEQELKSPSAENDRVLIFAMSQMAYSWKSGEEDPFIMVPAITGGDMLGRAVERLRKRGRRHVILINVSDIVRCVEKHRAATPEAPGELEEA